MSDGELAVARTIRVFLTRVNSWWCRCLFLNHRRWYLISQLVCHNYLVPGFTDGAGFRFGWVRQLLRSIRFLVSEVGLGTEAALFVCDDVVKTENLDWIFLLDVSLL